MRHALLPHLLGVTLSVLTPLASQALANDAEATREHHGGPVIVYLSRTGNTEAIANIIHDAVGGQRMTMNRS